MGALFGLLTALSIGIADLFGRRVVVRRGAVVAATMLQLVGVVATFAMLIVLGGEPIGADMVVGLASGVGFGIGLWGYLSGLGVSSSAVVAPIVAALSAVIPFTYTLVRGGSASALAIGGAVVAIGGLVLVSTRQAPAANVAQGVRWSVVSGLGYGFGLSVIIEATEASGVWPAAMQRLGALSVMVVIALRAGQGLPVSGVRIAGITAGTVGALSTVFYLLAVQADPTPAVVTASMFPAVTVVVGRFVYGDVVSSRQVVGLGVVLVGVIAVVAA